MGSDDLTPRQQLRKLLAQPGAIVVPGTFDAMSARLVDQAGFAALSVSGAAVTASLLGKPDVGLLTMVEMLNQVKNIVRTVTIPVMADGETGWGGPFNVMRTIQEFEAAGVASIFLEDQASQRRCGHFEGKEIISERDMVAKLHAALEARTDPDFLIMARTDARAVEGLDAALSRARAYAAAGVDMLFVEAPQTVEELKRVGGELADLGLPLKVNLSEGGRTPLVSMEELERFGYKIINWSGSVQKVAIKYMQDFLKSLRATGGVDAFYPSGMASLDERSQVLGLQDYYDLERRLQGSLEASQ